MLPVGAAKDDKSRGLIAVTIPMPPRYQESPFSSKDRREQNKSSYIDDEHAHSSNRPKKVDYGENC